MNWMKVSHITDFRWLQKMGLRQNFVHSNNALLCYNHFEKHCFQEGNSKGCFLPASIPTIFGQDKNRSFANSFTEKDQIN